MACQWHVRAATDQGAQFAPRIESLRADQETEAQPLRLVFCFLLLLGRIRRGAVVNGVPVARQSCDRPRRVVRAANRIPPGGPRSRSSTFAVGLLFSFAFGKDSKGSSGEWRASGTSELRPTKARSSRRESNPSGRTIIKTRMSTDYSVFMRVFSMLFSLIR